MRRRLPEPLAIRIAADEVDLSAAAVLTQTLEDLHGVVSADVRIGGTWDGLELSGGMEVRDAAVRIPAMNVRYEGINGRFTLRGDTILLDTLRARSGPGSASVGGHVRLANLNKPVLALSITANRFAAIDIRNRLSATVSGRLRLDGPLYGATLSGQGTVTEGVWYFRDAVAKRVVNLDEPWVRALIDTTLLDGGRLRSSFQSRFLDSLRIRALELRMGACLAPLHRVERPADRHHHRGQGQENAGMMLDQDGGIDIYIAAQRPKGVPEENWLPINRKDEDIGVIMRIYVPDLERMKNWKAPEAERITKNPKPVP